MDNPNRIEMALSRETARLQCDNLAPLYTRLRDRNELLTDVEFASVVAALEPQRFTDFRNHWLWAFAWLHPGDDSVCRLALRFAADQTYSHRGDAVSYIAARFPDLIPKLEGELTDDPCIHVRHAFAHAIMDSEPERCLKMMQSLSKEPLPHEMYHSVEIYLSKYGSPNA